MRTVSRAVLVASMAMVVIGIGIGQVARGGAFEGFATPGTPVSAYLKNATALHEDALLVPAPQELAGEPAVLRLRYDNELYAEFHPVPVDLATSYTIRFRGRWTNRQTIENAAVYRSALRETWETGLEALPVAAIEFADESGKKLEARILAVLPYGQWRSYRFSFYPPPGAATVQLKIKSGRNDGELFITSPKLESAAPRKPGEIVMNFRQDDEQDSGRAFGLLIDESVRPGGPGGEGDGHRLASGGDGRTAPFAIAEAGTFRLSVKGAARRDKSRTITVTFIGPDNKKTGDASSPDLTIKPLEFTVPPGTAGAYLTIPHYHLDEIRIEPTSQRPAR